MNRMISAVGCAARVATLLCLAAASLAGCAGQAPLAPLFQQHYLVSQDPRQQPVTLTPDHREKMRLAQAVKGQRLDGVSYWDPKVLDNLCDFESRHLMVQEMTTAFEIHVLTGSDSQAALAAWYIVRIAARCSDGMTFHIQGDLPTMRLATVFAQSVCNAEDVDVKEVLEDRAKYVGPGVEAVLEPRGEIRCKITKATKIRDRVKAGQTIDVPELSHRPIDLAYPYDQYGSPIDLNNPHPVDRFGQPLLVGRYDD